MNTARLAETCGLSTRQVGYWTTRGWLHLRECPLVQGTSFDGCQCAETGSGSVHDYPASEVEVALRMAALVQASVAPAFANLVARSMVARGLNRCAVLGHNKVPVMELVYLEPGHDVEGPS